MRYALIENNQVKDIFIEPKGVSIKDCLHPSIVSLYIPCPDNIEQGDFYNEETKEFSENPNKKTPDYFTWITSLQNKLLELEKYYSNLNPIINGYLMGISEVENYKRLLQDNSEQIVEIENNQFSVSDFQSMINSLEKFILDKNFSKDLHIKNINSFNNAEDIDAYDFTTGCPEITISI